ncbi:Monooxygenase FAD-binding protein [Macrophomina phaseolina MS6]|uniref:Monooxygenase FAD-binding protein n=1 Tax=Macrophomina phaseolina (strain MS6) TaxID=1126212 RepID=K2SYE1_MACPH|nr:Monooxygenase FAD-binding protein [Macrophomina phaseolina MS6]
MPPTGGMCGNTGVQDVYNLAWELAFVVHSRASDRLLATYSTEHQGAAGFAVEQAYIRYANRVSKDPKAPHEEELPDGTVELGYHYPDGASVCESDENENEKFWEDPYAPTATPGSRQPHVFLPRNGKDLSTLDLVKRNFVILSVGAGSPWNVAASKQDVPVDAYGVFDGSKEALGPTGRFSEVCGLKKGQALLVRPDGFVAWRAPALNQGHAERLKEVLGEDSSSQIRGKFKLALLELLKSVYIDSVKWTQTARMVHFGGE